MARRMSNVICFKADREIAELLERLVDRLGVRSRSEVIREAILRLARQELEEYADWTPKVIRIYG